MSLFDDLEEAAAIATGLGLADQARAANELVERAAQRLGFPGEVYVLALAGGTGVGKSSVLNALADQAISPARVLRPTTEQPIAWVSNDAIEELRPLLDWLAIERVVGHDRTDLAGVAILDLPDVDSIRLEHHATVDALLPRIDAVTWVVDPEKYDDERLHEYLRRLAPHAKRMRFIFNKADRLDPDQRLSLVDDFKRRLASDDIPNATVVMVSAADGTGIDDLRAELSRTADAKAIVASKFATDAVTEIALIARAAGVEPGEPHTPLLADGDRTAAIASRTVAGAISLVDPDGVARQMQEAVLHRARRQGGSLLARIIALLTLITGRKKRRAEPASYLADWRKRGSLGHLLNPVRSALVSALGRVPPGSRPMLLKKMGSDEAEVALSSALDRSTRQAAEELVVPNSVLWPVVGFLQLLAGAVLVFSIAWYLTIIFGPGGLLVSTVDVPVLGPVPMPLLLLAGSLALSIFLGLVLATHAGWIGRRTGQKVAIRTAEEVASAIAAAGFSGLDAVEAGRLRLASLVADARASRLPPVSS